MRLALYQPDMAGNVGAAIRVAACFGAGLDIIEPCGFPLDARDIRRAAMDYAALAAPVRHASWRAFCDSPERRGGRLLLLTTRAARPIWEFAFQPDDVILLGRESAGAPEAVHAAADARLLIPLAPGARSLNVAVAGAVALAEARRQIGYNEASMI
ncbi:tRNA (cytidine(34)-2'-O)-methyltransferase [Amphiplicatus metriothermophilus]|uniref:tRNA (cytidine(34)-2'-O)-methyltransferase n=1 Tax=Amphiplicatus metriothermophilus TaxID=1519374 RepID=A0A239PUR0_9PROT|nr:TrmH family RNA methyltransferase [Amphiplicatus metriothermophilus]MBB5519460.1 tRNA (cytidine/uridine-2'-O-)-methyltransferase [Amphiplicatus metriothermophilus]SNT73666.1 tRNA (cytidine/uridine-2'-O-)-methyltransferase [Amphiplicatus metriothermophilus]